MRISITKRLKLTPVQILVIGFALVILTGGILLALPISSADGANTSFIDSLFTSTSAVCVTGLVTLDTGTHWNYFGKTIIIFLIQIGGLGFMSFATLFALIMGKKITLRERLVMQEAMNTFDLQGLVKLAKYILIFTFSVEAIGAVLLSTQFIPQLGVGKGIYYSFFHSISAFCNAGFDIIGGFRSLTVYSNNAVIILTIGSLIIIGGLGFAVWADIYNYKGLRKLSLHSKVVLTITAMLIVIGTILMFLIEQNNPATIAPMSVKGKFLSSWFAAVSPRTAGFNSISTSEMMPASRFLTILLMFIGGSPGSTAGGIKTTTFGIIIFSLISVIKGREDTVIYNKRISKDLVFRSYIIITIAVLLVTTITMILTITEVGATLEYIVYEVVSGFATVGLTLGLTPNLSVIGKALIMFTMFCGRVGPLTIALALAKKRNVNLVRYPEDKILVG